MGGRACVRDGLMTRKVAVSRSADTKGCGFDLERVERVAVEHLLDRAAHHHRGLR